MIIYLLQHGHCLDKEIDPNRGLSSEGKMTTLQVVKTASDAGIVVTNIYHSGKLRAQQTAEFFYEHLNAGKINPISGLSPLDNVANFANHFQFTEKIMIVGHLPFLERLTSYLITGSQELTVVKFQNSGIVCLDQNEKNNWFIKWTIMPVIN